MPSIGSSGMQRLDEHRLTELRERAQKGDATLTEVDLLWLSVLEDRYTIFLEEGMKALRASQPKERPGSGSFTDSFADGSSFKIGSPPSSGGSFVGSLLNRVGGRRFGRGSPHNVGGSGGALQQETTRLCKHWTWIADNLIVGAIPLAQPNPPDPSAHLIGLKEQCKERNTCINVVVSALEFDEAAGPDLHDFASPREWEIICGATAFVHIGLPRDFSATITMRLADMAAACVQIHDAVTHKAQCVYIHCKAGLHRCWVVAMCYLIAHRNMTLTEARELLAVLRPQCCPSGPQEAFVAQFEDYIRELRAPLRSKEDDEATYVRLLAELLSLPPEFRRRLLRDIEHLT